MSNNRYIQIIKKYYPNLNEEEIELFNDGWDHIIYVVDKINVFRFPRKEEYAKNFHIEEKFLKEFSILSNIKIPQIKVQVIEEITYETYKFIAGVQLSNEVASQLTEKNLLKIAQQMGEFLTILHSFSVSKAKEIGIRREEALFNNYWQKRDEEVISVLKGALQPSELEWINKLYSIATQIFNSSKIEQRVIHGDIMPEHILIAPESFLLEGIIDFSDMAIGDSAYDFAYLNKYGDKFLEEVYKNYDLVRDDLFEKRRFVYESNFMISHVHHYVKLQQNENAKINIDKFKEYILKNPLN